MHKDHEPAELWRGAARWRRKSPKAQGVIAGKEAKRPEPCINEHILAAAISAVDEAIERQGARLKAEERASAQAAIYAAGWRAPTPCAQAIVAFLRLSKGADCASPHRRDVR